MAHVRDEFALITEPTEAPPSPELLKDGLRHADAAICTLTERITDDVLPSPGQLKIVANYAVGYNNIDLEAAQARHIIVTNTPDVLTETTADLTWALILATARRILEGDGHVRSGNWTGWAPTQLLGMDVSGATLGVIGMGRIGQAVARRAAGFRTKVLYCSHRSVSPPDKTSQWHVVSLPELLAQSDFVSLHVPLTHDTHHLIDGHNLTLMKPTTFLINTSRGPVVDESALVEALTRGTIAGAGLDVYEREPRVDPRLLTMKQVVLLPHLGSATLATRVRMGQICVANIRAVLAGEPAPNRVA